MMAHPTKMGRTGLRTTSIVTGCIGVGLCCLFLLGPVELTVGDHQQRLVSIVMRDRQAVVAGGGAPSPGSTPSPAPPRPHKTRSVGSPSSPLSSSSAAATRPYVIPPLAAVASVLTPTIEQAVRHLEYSVFGCLAVGRLHATTKHADNAGPESCATACAAEAYPIFGISSVGGECWCTDVLNSPDDVYPDASNCDRCSEGDRSCEVKRQPRSVVYNVTSALPEIIKLYIVPHRTSCFFNSGRLEQFFSGRFAIRKKTLDAQLTTTDARWYREVCKDNIGKKIFVQVQGAVVHLLKHFPDNSVFIMTAGEVANWGLGKGDRRFGPHGKTKSGEKPDFATDEESEHKKIVLPNEVWPMFRQYFHYRQIEAFGAKMRFFPLGSRAEFATIEEPTMPATDRKYVYSYMAALTDGTRRQVADLLQSDTEIGEEKRFIQISQSWHANVNNDEYVSPDMYQKIMQDSVFSICPKGHSVEQFRIYEAIESGSIPVMELHSIVKKNKVHGYLAQHLPPEYINSPMLLLDSWPDVVPEMLKLWRDPVALLERQKALLEWYDHFMRNKMTELEDELIEKGKQPANPFCKAPLFEKDYIN